MPTTERRVLPRRSLTVPVRYRVVGNNTDELQTGESLNWSERGIFFTTNSALKVGTPLEMYMKIPYQGGGAVTQEVRCAARVVHVKPNAGPDGRSGVGVFVDRFDAGAVEAHTQA